MQLGPGDYVTLFVMGASAWGFARWARRQLAAPTRAAAVKTSVESPAPESAQTKQTDQTDGPDEAVSDADRWLDRLEVDRTRAAVLELLVYSGWDVSQIRGVIKGDTGAIGAEVRAARQRLGILTEPRTLVVREGADERVIPFAREA